MADKTLTVNGQPFTFNRDRFAGVRTMTATTPLSDGTTEMQVTVTGTDSNGNDNSSLSGTYTRANSTATSWSQVGGNGNIYLLSGSWNFIDGSDGTPNFTVTGSDKVPWQVASSFASNNVTLSSAEETVTVDRTASVIDSDRAGESRPLLSKVVGGAAVAYSLRDLNDKQGNNKVITTRRLTDGHERNFLAKEVSNGNLTSYANEKVIYFDTTGTSVEHVSYFGRTYSVVHGGGFPVTFSSTGGFNNTEKYAFTGAGNNAGFGSNFYWNNALNTGRIGVASASKQVTVEGYVRRTNGSSSDKFYVRSYASGGNKFSVTNLVQDEWTFFSGTLDTLNANAHIQFGGDTGVDLEVSNIKFSTNKHDVHVTTWYDQSGNNKHATQATTSSQPKIVITGSLVSGGLDFDGSNDFLSIPLTGHNIGNLSSFCVGEFDNASGNSDIMLALGTGTGNSRWYAPFGSSSNIRYGYGSSSSGIAQFSASTDVKLHTMIAGTTIGNASGFENGTLKGTATRVTTTSAGTIGIGNLGSSFPLDGKVQEVIVYTSDQSANRPAIEANIANQYGITLS